MERDKLALLEIISHIEGELKNLKELGAVNFLFFFFNRSLSHTFPSCTL